MRERERQTERERERDRKRERERKRETERERDRECKRQWEGLRRRQNRLIDNDKQVKRYSMREQQLNKILNQKIKDYNLNSNMDAIWMCV